MVKRQKTLQMFISNLQLHTLFTSNSKSNPQIEQGKRNLFRI